jgi:hypothetical protein
VVRPGGRAVLLTSDDNAPVLLAQVLGMLRVSVEMCFGPWTRTCESLALIWTCYETHLRQASELNSAG